MAIDNYVIRIYDEVGGDSAISVDDGDALYKKIDNALVQNITVVLDFQNINLIITAFLNAAIGQLYSKYNSDQLNEKLKLENVKSEDVHLFKKVIERAKEYFANPDEFENNVTEP
ncbi:MAG TPA: STAS-like domain-containing protein [Bacteroidales bacterium]|nr:STAS-like domain-containing protein [Bacteroidales bacterium]